MSAHCPTTVECRVQDRLGALDRVLGAFTHRGIVPGRMEVTRAENTLQIRVEFDCDDQKALERLVKFLQKQVYVLEAHALQPAAATVATVTELFVSDVTRRRVSHVHNA